MTTIESTPRTLPVALRAAIASHSGVALRSPSATDPGALSFADVLRAGDEIAAGLASLGIEAGDRVAILSSTRAEWTLADLGPLWAGATVVPIYNTNSPEECQYVLTHSGSRVVFCEDEAQLRKLESVRDLEHRILLTGDAAGAMTLSELRERERGVEEPVAPTRTTAIGPDDVATLVYTSGTPGRRRDACSLTATWCRRSRCTARAWSWGPACAPVSSCRSRTRSRASRNMWC
jgi:long-chain acyl-CoA synthetase